MLDEKLDNLSVRFWGDTPDGFKPNIRKVNSASHLRELLVPRQTLKASCNISTSLGEDLGRIELDAMPQQQAAYDPADLKFKS